jgi:hypothetical protein
VVCRLEHYGKSAPSSTSMVDAIMLRMMELMMWMAPFWGGGWRWWLGGIGGAGAEKENSTCAAARRCFGQIARIAV